MAVGYITLILVLSIAAHLMLAVARAQHKPPPPAPLTASEPEGGIWCGPCNAPVAVRVALRHGDDGTPVTAYLTVCAWCGTRQMPTVPRTELSRERGPRPNPRRALAWAAHRRDCKRRGVEPRACAYGNCQRPGWWDCAWYELVDDGRIRWMFCGAKHRKQWLEMHGYQPVNEHSR